ncbi:MAG: FAD-dependent oxidoreductase [Deltaproteobacteria bacterium]|nr:FAD-dependent oxidoreductase [Deltaproteobacteria bacterium]
MKRSDVLVVGGSAAGLTAAITARRHYPDKSITVIRKEQRVVVPCGIPYIFGTLGSPDKNLIPDAIHDKNKLDLVIAEATELDREKKVLQTSDGEFNYERLIIATGSHPAMPPVPGFDLEGVCAIVKDVAYLSDLQKRIGAAKKVVIIGGGFIGIEFADEINKLEGKQVHVIELLPHCLALAYDEEFCTAMEEVIRARGVDLITGVKVDRVLGEGKVSGVALGDGRKLDADLVILGIGAVANVDLAKRAGLRIGLTGGITVDRAMKTSDDAIFACGDCAEKISFFGGRPSPLKLASIASQEARIAGANLYGLRRESPGTVGAWSTAVGDTAIATAGLTEEMARKHGYDTVAVEIGGVNRHPGGMPGAVDTKLKAVFERKSGVLLGGQVMGDQTVGELVNAISACVQTRMRADDIAMFAISTHPALTASPIAYHLVNAAETAIGKM